MLLSDLTKFIKNTNIENKNDYLTIIKDSMNAFISYFNIVVDIEIFCSTVTEWNSITEYMYKNKDENRRNQHDICIAYCNEINKICEKLDFNMYINTSNRHEVACFIGDTINQTYFTGIKRNFDDLVKDYCKSGKTIPQIELGDL